MASTSSTSLSSPGIGSGLDVNSIISGLMAVEQRPIVALQKAEAKLQAKVSGLGQIQSLASGLNDALAAISKPETFTQTMASSSDPTSVFLSATATAAAGNYSVSVTSLAAAQTLVSPVGQFTAATNVVGTGTMTIRLGDWNNTDPPTTFTPKTGSSDIAITIDAASQTLEGIRDKINGANAGVTASIINDASGSRLSIRSNTTGEVNGFRISVAETGAPGLARLQYDPENVPAPASNMTYAQAASNSEGTINGIQVSSTTDTLTDAIPGLTFKFTKKTTSPVTTTVSTNVDAIRAAINKFVNAYNDFSKTLGAATSYDASTKQAGQFQGDATTVGMLSQVRSMIAQGTSASTTFGSFSSIGLELQKDGTLKVNSSKLEGALTKLPELSKALTSAGTGTSGSMGLAKRMGAYTDGLLSASGAFQTRTKSLQASIAANNKDQDRASDKLAVTEQRLRAQYTALDATMSKYTALNKYVTQQFANYNSSGDK